MTPLLDEIRASEIEAWGETHESAQWMPSLLLQLLAASGAKLKSCRFLTHEETTTGGLDGLVEADTVGLNVPSGISAWELSKKKNVKVKATKDAGKPLLEADPAQSTLVTVTLRVWPKKRVAGTKGKVKYLSPMASKQQAAEDLRKQGGWKAATIIDAADLASALAKAPGAAIWLASVMGRKVKGACSLKRHFEDLASLLPTGLPPQVFLAGREQFITALESFLAVSPSQITIHCPSSDDLHDALSAWWTERSLTPSAVQAGIAVQSNEAWEWLRNVSQPMLLYLEEGVDAAPEQVSAAIQRGHYIVLRTPVILSGHPCFLPLLPKDTLAAALRNAGFDHSKAWKLASSADGSGVVLKRLLGGTGSQPAWAKGAGAAKLAPVTLVGAWNGALPGDQESVAAIFGKPYPKIAPLLAGHVEVNHPLLRRNREDWRIVSREDTWHWLAPHLDSATCARFETAAKAVLTEIDPRYSAKADQRLFAEVFGLKNSRSALLKVGIAEALCLFSLQPPAPLKLKGPGIARRVVANSLPPPGHWQHWASLGGALPLLAEAAPDETLQAIEADLLDPKPGTAALFGEGGDGPFGQHTCANLMWLYRACCGSRNGLPGRWTHWWHWRRGIPAEIRIHDHSAYWKPPSSPGCRNAA